MSAKKSFRKKEAKIIEHKTEGFCVCGSRRQWNRFLKTNTGSEFSACFQRLGGRNYEGTGIGLSIAKKIVENHGGYLIAQGEPKLGATFFHRIAEGKKLEACSGVFVQKTEMSEHFLIPH